MNKKVVVNVKKLKYHVQSVILKKLIKRNDKIEKKIVFYKIETHDNFFIILI